MNQQLKKPNTAQGVEQQTLSILLVLPGYPLMANGLPSYACWLVDELKKNHKVTVLVTRQSGSRQLQHHCENGVDIYSLFVPDPVSSRTPFKSFIAWLRDLPGALLNLRRLVADKNIDIIHTTFHSYNYLFRVYRALGGPKYLITLHGSETYYHDSIPKPYQALTRFVVQGADQIIAVSDALREMSYQRFDKIKNVHTIYNGINTAETFSVSSEPLPDTLQLPEKFCLLVGRLHPVKGVDIAIKAWKDILTTATDAHLVIVGNGDEYDNYFNQINESNCQERIHLVGTLENAVVRKVMKKAELLIMPSRSEGLPLTCLEAGLAGLPMIASSVGGIPEIIDDGENGYLVAANDHQALTEAVLKLLSNPELSQEFSVAIKRKIETVFDSHVCSDQYIDIYRQLKSQG